MRFREKSDQYLYDRLMAQVEALQSEIDTLQRRLQWRANRLDALLKRTRCKKVPGCRHEQGHAGCHVT